MLSKEETTKQDWQKLCDECSNAVKEAGLTKEDTNRLIKETRAMQWKAKKYDELIEMLEKENEDDTFWVKRFEEKRRNTTDEFYKKSYQTTIHQLNAKRETRREILAILKGEKEL